MMEVWGGSHWQTTAHPTLSTTAFILGQEEKESLSPHHYFFTLLRL
jgi:hypothetical protein